MAPGAAKSVHEDNAKSLLWQSFHEVLKPLTETELEPDDGGLVGGFRCVYFLDIYGCVLDLALTHTGVTLTHCADLLAKSTSRSQRVAVCHEQSCLPASLSSSGVRVCNCEVVLRVVFVCMLMLLPL